MSLVDHLDSSHRSSDAPLLRSSRKVAFASLIGTTIEWYDFFIFGTAAALVFNEVFFPSFDPATGTLAAFASFSVGFIARPAGGAVFAHYGDKTLRIGPDLGGSKIEGILLGREAMELARYR